MMWLFHLREKIGLTYRRLRKYYLLWALKVFYDKYEEVDMWEKNLYTHLDEPKKCGIV